MKKKCRECKLDKNIDQFTKKIDGKYGVRTACKECEVVLRQKIANDYVLLEIRRSYNKKYKYKNRNNPLYKLKANLRSKIWSYCIAASLNKKSKHTQKIIGTSFDIFKSHIESLFDKHMSWNNYGKYWQIDHVKPLLLAKTKEELYILNHYSNLRPLENKENMKKGKSLLN